MLLRLPPAHSFQQFKLIHAWECRFHPDEAKLNSKFDPENVTPMIPGVLPPEAHLWLPKDTDVAKLPYMFEGLRFIVGACGTKFGKTYGCATRIAKEAWDNEGSLNWWVAPSYGQAEMAMDEIKKRLPMEMVDEKIAKYRLNLLNPNGKIRSVIQFKTADDPDLLRGAAVNFFVIDEAARGMPFKSFESVMTTVTQTMGRGIVISTPNGRGWFYDIYQRGDKKLYPTEWPEWFSLRMPTWVNPHVPMKAILDAKKNLPSDSFRQEYMAEFLQESAGVFKNVRGCVRGVMQPRQPGLSYVLGVDLARKHDYTVLTVMCRETKHVVYWDRFNQIDWNIQILKIIQCARAYNATISIDSTGVGDPIVSALNASGLDVVPYQIGTNLKKRQLIDMLRVQIEQGLISYPEIPVLIDELQRFQYKETASGVIQFEAPEGYHDDCVISLSLAVRLAAEERWFYRYYKVNGI